ncbi:MAG: hypothetical protein ACKVW3_08795 [Phycisphaerales bacterium]
MSGDSQRRTRALRMSAAGLWLGALIISGATAAIAFPMMKQLNPTLPGFAAYPGEHHRIAAGMIMARVFIACDALQVVSAVLVLVAGLLASRHRDHASIASRLGWIAIGVAVLTLAAKLALLDPIMRTELNAFWAAASSGSLIDAELHRARFDALHPRASRIMVATAALVLGAIVAWIVSGLPRQSVNK